MRSTGPRVGTTVVQDPPFSVPFVYIQSTTKAALNLHCDFMSYTVKHLGVMQLIQDQLLFIYLVNYMWVKLKYDNLPSQEQKKLFLLIKPRLHYVNNRDSLLITCQAACAAGSWHSY